MQRDGEGLRVIFEWMCAKEFLNALSHANVVANDWMGAE